MAETDHSDGNIHAGLRGLITAISMNPAAYGLTTILGPITAAACWAFVPSLWEAYLSISVPAAPKSAVLATVITGVATVATGLPIWIGLHRQWVTKRVADEQTGQQAALIALLRGYLIPCIEGLPAVATGGSDRTAALASVKRAVLNAAQAICGPQSTKGKVRAVRFEVERQVLVSKDWTGGASRSTRRFTKRPNDPAGIETWKRAESGEPYLCRDLRKERPDGYDKTATTSYQTFISCGILDSEGHVCGMLSVDAPEAGMLTEVDQIVVGVCAKVLSAAYALSRPRATV